jgi:hypothetical protein
MTLEPASWIFFSTKRKPNAANLIMSAQEMLIEEIKRQPETVVREVLHYLKFIERQRELEDWADLLPSREVEQEKLDILDHK